VEAFSGDEQLRPGLIPFAGNGYGDRYCWYPQWQTGSDTPVVFFVHDQHESHLFARSFDECLVRCMLGHFAAWDEDDDGDESVMESLWQAHLEILRPLLPKALFGVLEQVSESLSASACEAADEELHQAIGKRRLVGALQPTKYQEEYIKDKKMLLRLYDQSVAFYHELVDMEIRPEFRARLEETLANRARVGSAAQAPAKIEKAARRAPPKQAGKKAAPKKARTQRAPTAKKTPARKSPAKKTPARKAAKKA
jgi:hypothetical protein